MPEFGLLTLHALTSLHPGAGSSPGVVDLAIQREPHTRWPRIVGSSLKGVLRDRARGHAAKPSRTESNGDDDLVAVFGPVAEEASKHAGALCVADARILAFPVRATKGTFAWLTSPGVFERLGRDLSLAGEATAPLLPAVEEGRARCVTGSPLLQDGRIGLEEFEYDASPDNIVDKAGAWLAARVTDAEEAVKRLVVLNDEDFTHFVRRATLLVARIAMESYETKHVQDRALFYEEMLPPETLMYAIVQAHPARNGKKTATDVMQYLKTILSEHDGVIQVGADATVGVGWCRAQLAWSNAS